MTTDLVLDDVTLIRGGNTLVDDLDVVVTPKQTLAVAGASGAGKTTLLKAISGLSPYDHGSVTRPEGRLVQVFQEPRLLPWHSAHRNVALVIGGETPGLVAQQWLTRVDLQQATHLCPRQPSGGMRQRAATARVMAINSTLLLVDEPFSALDKSLATALQADLMQLLTEQEVVTVWITHDPEGTDDVSHLHLHLDGPPGTWRLTAEANPVPDPKESTPDRGTS